jgi:hypothetical protein
MALLNHLSEDECLAYVQHTLTDAERTKLAAHVDGCEKCTDRIAELIERAEVPLAAPGASQVLSENAQGELVAALVASSQQRERLRSAAEPILRDFAAAGDDMTRRELLSWLGSTASLNELLLESGAPRDLTQRLLDGLPQWLTAERPDLLDQAERVAQALMGDVFERWKKQADQSPREEEGTATQLHAAASGPIRISEPHLKEPDYSLLIHETQHGKAWFTAIRCVGPNPKRRYAYRLTFAPRDEAAALAERGLSPERLGALRVKHALESKRWTALLDLLLPCRYGSSRENEQSLFSSPVEQGGVIGRLPGKPIRIHFWLLD